MNIHSIKSDDPRIEALQGSIKMWWDQTKQQMVKSATIYLPQGCPDWGEVGPERKRNNLCTFCALPRAVEDYRKAFYEGNIVPQKDHAVLFEAVINSLTKLHQDIHTIMIFNAGSFLATEANSLENQKAIIKMAADVTSVQRIVIESRAGLITVAALQPLMDIVQSVGKHLTVRIGVETKDDFLRMKILRKGHSRKELSKAMLAIKECRVQSGGYVLLKPAPADDLRRVMGEKDAPEEMVSCFAIEEAKNTLDWLLGEGEDCLGMDEAYFCSTNVGRETPLAALWKEGQFQPASLWMVYEVLLHSSQKYSSRVHLLPFKDNPEFLAVPSNHEKAGIREDLSDAKGCDKSFHDMFNHYRETMDCKILKPPVCRCKPDWI